MSDEIPTRVLDQAAIAEIAGLSTPGSDKGDTWARELDASDRGLNLFDPDDADVLYGYYLLETTGNAFTNASYNTTGFIPIEPSVTYIASSGDAITGAVSNRRCFYDKDKVFISGTGTGQPAAFTPPANAAYVRLVISRQYWPLLQLERGSSKTAYAPPKSRGYSARPANPFQREILRQTHSRLIRRRQSTPEDVQINIILPGDSYTHGTTRWSGRFAAYMAAKYGDAGGGWCGFGFPTVTPTVTYADGTQPANSNGNVRPAIYPTRWFGALVGNYYNQGSADLASVTLAATGDSVFQAFPATPVHNGCDLHFIGATGASVKYSWGAYNGSGDVADPADYTFGSATTITVAGTSGATQIVDIKTGMPSGAGALKIEWVTGSPVLCGVNLKSAAFGVRTHKIAATGSSIAQWNAAPTGFNTSFAALGGQLCVYMDGPNSQSGVAPASWGSNLMNVVGKFRTAAPGVDVLIATPPENQRTDNTYAIAAYAAEARRRAIQGVYAYIDMQPAFGISGDPTEYGSSGAVPLFNSDKLHVSDDGGGPLMLAEFLRVIEPA